MFWKNDYEKNIFLLYFLYAFYALAISWNVIHVLFLQANDLTFFQISLLMFIFYIVLLIMEIPSGMITDIYGRKFSIQLFSISILLATILFFSSNLFEYFILATIVFSLGSSFLSGTGDAILFESLRKLKKKEEYTKRLSRNHFFFLVLGIATTFLMPIIFGYNIKYPFYIAAIFGFLLLILSFMFTESLEKKRKIYFWKEIKLQFINSKKLFHNRFFVWIMFFSATLGVSQSLFGDVLNQPFVKEFTDLTLYGILMAVATVVNSFMTLVSDRILDFCKKYNEYLLLLLFWVISLTLQLVTPLVLFAIVMGFSWYMGTLRHIFVSTKINNIIKEDNLRATSLSINSMFTSFIGAIIMPIFGYTLDIISLREAVLYLGTITLIAGLIVLLFRKKEY